MLFIRFVTTALDEHKLARRLVVLWGAFMVTITINQFWDNLAAFGTPETVVIAIIGLMGVVFGFYHKSRENDKK